MPTRFSARRDLLRLTAGSALALPPLSIATAGDFPSKPVRIVVAFTPGAAPDLVARSIAGVLARRWNSAVVVENKLGADGVISSDFVAKAPPDGHTLYLATMGNIALAPAMMETLSYDARTAFRGVGFIAVNPFAILLRRDSSIGSVAELIAQSRKKALNYGSAGTLGPLIGELITKRTGADLRYISYKGAQPAITDLLGGHLDMVIADLPSLLPFQSQGKARLLAVTTKTRSALAPQVPTLAEAGNADFDFSTWYALVAPSATPGELIGRLNAELAEALRTPEVERQLQQLGMTPRSSTPEAMDELMRQEIDRWGALVKTRR